MSENSTIPPQWRENPEPHEKGNPVPWYMLVLAVLLTLFGVYYILGSDLDGASTYGDGRTMVELRGKAASAPGDGQTVDGSSLYASLCAACHQATGQGLPGVFPPLAGTESIKGDERRLSAIVLHGVTGTLTVGGTAYNGVMPPFKDQLKDPEVAAVLTHIRAQWNNGAAPVGAETVTAVRESTADRTASFNGDADLAAFK